MGWHPRDTSEAAWEMQHRVWSRMGPERRLLSALASSEAVRRLAADGVRSRHPEWSEDQVKREVFRMIHGEALCREVFGDPEGR